jgi:hypothetical protein
MDCPRGEKSEKIGEEEAVAGSIEGAIAWHPMKLQSAGGVDQMSALSTAIIAALTSGSSMAARMCMRPPRRTWCGRRFPTRPASIPKRHSWRLLRAVICSSFWPSRRNTVLPSRHMKTTLSVSCSRRATDANG